MREEWEEYAPKLEPWKPFSPDGPALKELSDRGDLWIAVARVNGAMAAYLFWSFGRDLESKGHWIASQGLWFASRRFAGLQLGVKLLRWSLEDFRGRTGVPIELDLHAMTFGSGKRLDSLFRRLGARPLRIHWSLKLEPKDCS
jgi:hypothetical protein